MFLECSPQESIPGICTVIFSVPDKDLFVIPGFLRMLDPDLVYFYLKGEIKSIKLEAADKYQNSYEAARHELKIENRG